MSIGHRVFHSRFHNTCGCGVTGKVATRATGWVRSTLPNPFGFFARRIGNILCPRNQRPAWRRIPWTSRLAALGLIAAILFGVHPVLASAIGEEARDSIDSALKAARDKAPLRWIWDAKSSKEKNQAAAAHDPALDVDHFRLCPRYLQLYVGEDFVLAPAPLTKDRKPVNGVGVKWTTSNASVATVTTVGEVDAVAPGRATIALSAGVGHATVTVDVSAGYRPRQTDSDWDRARSGDCTNPESAELNDPVQAWELARAAQHSGTAESYGPVITAEHDKVRGPHQPDAATLARNASYRAGSTSGSVYPHAAAKSAVVPPLQLVPIIEQGNPDPTVSSGTVTAPGNFIGSPRLAAFEHARGGATKLKNILASPDYLFTAPVISLPGRDAALDLALSYNSQLWTKDPNSGAMFFDTERGYPVPGWRIGYGRIIVSFNGTSTGNGSGGTPADYPGDLLVIQPDGNPIVMTGSWDGATFEYASGDGRFLTYNYMNGKLRYPDGTLVTYNIVNNRLLPVQIRTRNGNTITVGYRTRTSSFPIRWAIDTISDNLGRLCFFLYYGDGGFPADTTAHPATALAAIQVADQTPGPFRNLALLDYKTVTINYNFAFVDSSAPASGSHYWMMNSITYPATGRGYTFPDYSSYGMIRKISVRNGMNGSSTYGNEIAYTFYNYPADTSGGQLNDSPQYTQRQEFWQGKTDAFGNPDPTPTTYGYSRVIPGDGLSETTTVSSPDGTQVASTTSLDSTSVTFGRMLSVVTTNGGSTLSSISYTYTSDTTDSLNIPLVSAVSTSMDGGPTAVTNYTYGQFARVNTVVEQGFTGTAQRKTTYSYVDDTNYTTTDNMLYLVNSVVVTDKTTNQDVARTDFVYDEASPGLLTYSQQAVGHDYTHFDQTNLVRGNVTSTIQYKTMSPPSTKTWTTQYDVLGNTVNQALSCCQQKVFTFSQATQWSLPDSEVDGAGPTITSNFQYNFNTSLLTSSTDADGNPTSYLYDAAWRPSQVNSPTGGSQTTNFDNDGSGNDLLSYTGTSTYLEADGITRRTITSRTWFDGSGHALRTGTGSGSSPVSFDATSTIYDSMGRPARQSNPYTGDVNGQGSAPITVNSYDGLSRVFQVTLPDSNTISTSYSANTETITDQVGRKRKTVNDGLGRPTVVFEQDPASGSVSVETDLTYDMLNNLKTVNQGGPMRSYSYDALSRLTNVTTPEAGSVSYSYFDFNAVETRTDGRGAVTNYTYDGINRLQTISYTTIPAGVAPTTGVSITYNTTSPGNGQTQSVTDGAGSESHSYDGFGRLVSKTRTIDGNGYQTQYQYNQAGQLALMIYPSGKRFRMDYDARGRFSGEDKVDTSGNILTPYVQSSPGIAYNAAQQPTSLPLGNGVSEFYSYDSQRLQLTGQSATKGSSTLMNLTYSYQAAALASGAGTNAGNSGQLMAISPGSTIASQARDQKFTYDNVGRLVTATGWGVFERRYTYDYLGNRTASFDATSGGNQLQNITLATTGGATNNRIAAVNGVTYSYDLSGNLISDGTHTYLYDAEGRIAKVDPGTASEADYSYDLNNWRVKKVTGVGGSSPTTTYYVWEGGRVIAEYSTAPPASTTAIKYYHTDRLSTRMITDSNGSVIGTEDVLPFGEEAGTSSGVSEKHRFTNYERDSETSTDYALNRQYPSSLGRFHQPDGSGGSALIPQSLNRYTYSVSDPVNFIDPTGLDWFADWLNPAFNNYRNGADFANWITDQENRAFFGSSYWDLPGNANDQEQFEWNYVHYMLPKTYAVNTETEEETLLYDPAANQQSNPCAGVKASDLDYSVVRKRGPGLFENATDHITRRHILVDSGAYFLTPSKLPIQAQNASKYVFQDNVTKLGDAQALVQKLNAVIFTANQANPQWSHGNILMTFTAPPVPNAGGGVFAGFGFDRNRGFGLPTNAATLILASDCKTVITSYPGLP
jgi:RHS repeat-associated protein